MPIAATAITRVAIATALAGILGLAALAALPQPGRALTCATPPNGAELAIRTGWPEAAPLDHVVIGTILDIRPLNGDAGTWGQVLTVRLDAVLRGNLRPSTMEIFNPPLGSPGWPWFRTGGQFLIAAHETAEWSYGLIATGLCAPNELIESPERFQELLSFSASPVLSDTAMRPRVPRPIAGLGWVLMGLALTVVVRRRMSADGVHR